MNATTRQVVARMAHMRESFEALFGTYTRVSAVMTEGILELERLAALLPEDSEAQQLTIPIEKE